MCMKAAQDSADPGALFLWIFGQILQMHGTLETRALLASDAFHPHTQAKQLVGGGDDERLPVFAAEADVGGPGGGNGNVPDPFPFRVEHRHSHPGEIEVPFAVDRHPVRSHLTEELLAREGPVGLDGVAIRFAGADIGDVEEFSVRGADDAVRLHQVVGHPPRFLPRRPQVVDALDLLRLVPVRPVFARVEGVGEVEPARGAHPEVVRPVQPLRPVVPDDDLHFPRGGNAPQFAVLIRAGPEISVGIETQPVGAPRLFLEQGELAVDAPDMDAVVRLIREVGVPFRVAGGPFRKAEPVCKQDEFGPGSDDRRLGLQGNGRKE